MSAAARYVPAVLCLTGFLAAQPEPEREFCDDSIHGALCPGDDCPCTDDVLAVAFEGQLDSSIFEYDTFDPEQIVRSRVVLETVSEEVRGFSFAVEFDPDIIEVIPGPQGLNIDGGPMGEDPPTAALPCRQADCPAGRFIVRDRQIVGYIFSAVLSFQEPLVLPLGVNRIINFNFRLRRDVGPQGTMLRFVEDLGNPPSQTTLTVDELTFPEMVERDEGNCADGVDNDADGLVDRDDSDCVVRRGVSRFPRTLVDGVVRRAVERAPFRRGDVDRDTDVDVADAILLANVLVGVDEALRCDPALDTNDDGALDVSDAVNLIDYLLRDGPPLPEPFTDCGEDRTFDQLVCLETNCR